jgi:hypothetical protein
MRCKVLTTAPDSPRASRRAVTLDPPLGFSDHDYADCFEIRLTEADTHTAEQWARVALEELPGVVRRAVLWIHRRVLRLQLAPPASSTHILGWQVVNSEPDAIHLEARGPLIRAALILRRTQPTVTTFATFICYEQPVARVVWTIVGPLHRSIAPHLLMRGASFLGRAAQHASSSGAASSDSEELIDSTRATLPAD